MRGDTKVLYQKTIKMFYYLLTLCGNRRVINLDFPFLGLGNVQFDSSNVFVPIAFKEGEWEVNLSIYEGYPDAEDIKSGRLCFAGQIDVGNNGINIDKGGQKEATLQWKKGATAILLILNIDEVVKREVTNIAVFLKHM